MPHQETEATSEWERRQDVLRQALSGYADRLRDAATKLEDVADELKYRSRLTPRALGPESVEAMRVQEQGGVIEETGQALQLLTDAFDGTVLPGFPSHGTQEGTAGGVQYDFEDGILTDDDPTVLTEAEAQARDHMLGLIGVPITTVEILRDDWRRKTEGYRKRSNDARDDPPELAEIPRQDAVRKYAEAGFKATACDLLVTAQEFGWETKKIQSAQKLPARAQTVLQVIENDSEVTTTDGAFRTVDDPKDTVQRMFNRKGFGEVRATRDDRFAELKAFCAYVLLIHGLEDMICVRKLTRET